MIDTTIYDHFVDGLATPVQTLRSLCRDLGEVESELIPLQAQRDLLRAQISEVLTMIDGENAVVPGFGVVKLTSASYTLRYDTDRLDAVLDELEETHPDIAQQIARCQIRGMRMGGLRIERE